MLKLLALVKLHLQIEVDFVGPHQTAPQIEVEVVGAR